jgi:hypothetical protein
MGDSNMHKNVAIAVMALIITILMIGCASTEDSFLGKSVPDDVKSKIVTDEGIDAYNTELMAKGDLSKIDSVKQYFTIALKYDPRNATAKRYLDLTNNFKATLLQSILKEAKALAKKASRSEDETLKLCVLLQRAYDIDPKNAELQSLDKSVTPARNALVATYLARAKAASESQAKAKTPDAQEPYILASFQSLSKAVSADPRNSQARSLMDKAKPQVTAIVQAKMKSVGPLMEKGSLTAARAKIDAVASLSSKLGGTFDNDVKKAYYDLYYTWAKYFFDRKDYTQADIKISAALTYINDPAAVSFKQRNAALKAQAEQGTNFDDGIANVDALISRGSLSQAMRILTSLATKTSEKAKIDQIGQRKVKIQNALAALYQKGVAAYQAEKFDDAIDALEDVVGVDPGYQQAADYLDKAKEKQAILASS